MISGSSIERVRICPASEALPHAGQVTRWNRRGSVIHQYLADVPEYGRTEALLRVPSEHVAACEAIDLSRLPACRPDSYAAEVAMAYDVETDTARELGRGEGRNYGDLRPSEIPGSTDVVALTETSVVVYDYKSGYADVADPAVNDQLRFYALCASRIWDRRRARVAIIRIREDGESWFETADLSEIDLDAFAEELRGIVSRARAAKAGDRVVTGAHCRYCPAIAHCPAKTRLVQAMAHDPQQFRSSAIPPALDAESARTAWEKIKAAKALLEAMEQDVRDYAARNPVPLRDGWVLGPKVCRRETIDGGVAHRVLSEWLGADAADGACRIMTSKAAITDAVRPIAKNRGVTIKGLNEATIEAIRDRGGVRTKTKKTVIEHKSPRPAVDGCAQAQAPGTPSVAS